MKAAAYLILEEEENKSHIPYKYKETKIWKVFKKKGLQIKEEIAHRN